MIGGGLMKNIEVKSEVTTWFGLNFNILNSETVKAQKY